VDLHEKSELRDSFFWNFLVTFVCIVTLGNNQYIWIQIWEIINTYGYKVDGKNTGIWGVSLWTCFERYFFFRIFFPAQNMFSVTKNFPKTTWHFLQVGGSSSLLGLDFFENCHRNIIAVLIFPLCWVSMPIYLLFILFMKRQENCVSVVDGIWDMVLL